MRPSSSDNVRLGVQLVVDDARNDCADGIIQVSTDIFGILSRIYPVLHTMVASGCFYDAQPGTLAKLLDHSCSVKL